MSVLRKRYLSPRVHFALVIAVLSAALPLSLRDAYAQTASPSSSEFAASIREELLGYDATRRVLAYVERTPSGFPGYRHVSIVEVPQQSGPTQRVRLTTDVDISQMRSGTVSDARSAVEARVQRDLAAARERYQPGTVLPVSEASNTIGCVHPPYGPREFTVGDAIRAHAIVSSDGGSTSLYLSRNDRDGAPTEIPSVLVTSSSSTIQAPYHHLLDARELPGIDMLAVLVRSDACTPEGSPVPVRATFVAAPPPPERALTSMPHAELNDYEVLHVLAPHAHRRTVDEVVGYFEGRTQVVFNTAWQLPGDGEIRYLVQFARHDESLPPTVSDLGQAPASFAIMARTHSGGLRVVSQVIPPTADNVFEGIGSEAYSADLEGDGTPEVIVRSRYRPDGEVGSLYHLIGDSIQYVWHGTTEIDQRGAATGASQVEHRTCTLGVDNRTLVVRCQSEFFRPNAPRDAPFLSCSRLVQRLRWNGAVLEVSEERR